MGTERQHKKIIITRRVWQFIALMGFVLMRLLARYYPLGFHFGIRLFGGLFLSVFGLTYIREERRATKSPNSNTVINWNLAESILLLFGLLGFFIFSFIRYFDEHLFYACFNTGFLSLLSGVAIGELFWQNIGLRKLDESCRQRYWANYKNSIW